MHDSSTSPYPDCRSADPEWVAVARDIESLVPGEFPSVRIAATTYISSKYTVLEFIRSTHRALQCLRHVGSTAKVVYVTFIHACEQLGIVRARVWTSFGNGVLGVKHFEE